MSMPSYSGIIFDCDGVLVDSVSISNRILLEMLQPFGPPELFQQAIDSFQTGSLKDMFDEINHLVGYKLPSNFEADFRTKTYSAFSSELRPVEGILTLLDNIDRQSIPYCVASSGPVEKIRSNLRVTNLLSKFEDKIFSSYDINSWKPDPDIFLHAAKQMNFVPCSTLVIEDSPGGIRAAQRGGFQAVALAKEEHRGQFAGFDIPIFSSLASMANFLLRST